MWPIRSYKSWFEKEAYYNRKNHHIIAVTVAIISGTERWFILSVQAQLPTMAMAVEDGVICVLNTSGCPKWFYLGGGSKCLTKKKKKLSLHYFPYLILNGGTICRVPLRPKQTFLI
jgi:hypothetical protein